MENENKKFDIDELMAAIEEIRSEPKYQHIPLKLLQDIVKTELENQDDRASASKKVQAILENYIKEVK